MSSDDGDLSCAGLYNTPHLDGRADFSMTSIQTAGRFNDDSDDRRVSMWSQLAGPGRRAFSVPWQLCATEHVLLCPWASFSSPVAMT